MAEVHHENIYFEGRVQGVGFRYQTLQVAREYEIAGFVRNLPDGRVHLEVEGNPSEVDAFVTAVTERMEGFIRRTERTPARRSPQFQGFTIK